ncbi:DUF2207 domain-containing protein [Gulosibacter molinativorax]|uniref:DUF2207 domain-containing protein n=2 Tax=Gulosibacter molinativorax TaxID=256821 RepID=A0ABT7CBA6_9MICO|nr:DUF2207 domain-containing protein [Gulosibacter molinativorax]
MVLVAMLAQALGGFGNSSSEYTADQTRVGDFEFESWTSDWYVGLERTPGGKKRSYAEVTETLVPVFPLTDQNRGIVRTVPLDTIDGQLEVTDVDVRDAQDNKVEFESHVSNGELTVEIGGEEFVHGIQTYVLTYTLRDVIDDLGNPEVQELYADLLPTWRPQRIVSFSARVILDPELAESLVGEASCYIGRAGATDQCEILEEGLSYYIAPSPMTPNVTVTLNFGFEQGTVPELSLLDRIGWFPFVVAVISFASLFVSAALLVVQLRRSRHAPGGTIVPHYEPRSDVSPQIAAHLMPGLSRRAFSSSVLYGAVHGALAIEESATENDSPRVWGIRKRRQELRLRQSYSRADLPRIEQRFVESVLFPRDVIVTVNGNKSVGSAYQRFVEVARASMVEQGFIENSGAAVAAKRRTLWVAVPSILLSFASFIVMLIVNGGALINLFLLNFLLLVIMAAVSRSVTTWLRTPTGALARDHLCGLRDYIRLAEADRIQALQSAETAAAHAADARVIDVYERLLPYASLFGLERTWVKELQAKYESVSTTPDWFHGYHPLVFASAVTQLGQPRSTHFTSGDTGGASSSGFGGGGMAGGGIGGGSVGGR